MINVNEKGGWSVIHVTSFTIPFDFTAVIKKGTPIFVTKPIKIKAASIQKGKLIIISSNIILITLTRDEKIIGRDEFSFVI